MLSLIVQLQSACNAYQPKINIYKYIRQIQLTVNIYTLPINNIINIGSPLSYHIYI